MSGGMAFHPITATVRPSSATAPSLKRNNGIFKLIVGALGEGREMPWTGTDEPRRHRETDPSSSASAHIRSEGADRPADQAEAPDSSGGTPSDDQLPIIP